MTKTICIHHNKDLDGYSSGAIVKRKFPDCELIGWDYGNPIPEIEEGADVIMIDISFPIEEIERLKKIVNKLTIIDHHLSFFKDFKNAYLPNEDGNAAESYTNIDILVDNKIHYVYQLGIAACEIGWKYFFPEEKLPASILLLGEYDTWRKQDIERWNNYIMPFQYGIKTICSSAETFPANLLEDPTYVCCANIIQTGAIILDYQKKQDAIACRCAFEVEYEGLRAICLNIGGASSNVFNTVYDEAKHDIMIPFTFTGRHWKASIYTTKPDIDCSVLCKKRGGGGHKMAAGFQVDEFADLFNTSKDD